MADQNTSTSTDDLGKLLTDQLGAGKEVAKGAENKEGQTDQLSQDRKEPDKAPALRTYSEEEWNKRQSSIDSQVSKLKSDYENQLTKFTDELTKFRQGEREKEIQSFLGQAETEGLDKGKTQTLTDRIRAFYAKEAELEQRAAEIAKKETLNLAVLSAQKADELIKEYELNADAKTNLMEYDNPRDMELAAAKLYREKAMAAGLPAKEILERNATPNGRDLSQVPQAQQLGILWDEAVKERKR